MFTLSTTTPRRGFTLIELLVVIAIIADPDRPAAAGRAEGPRGRRADQVRQQPQADRPGRPQLSRRRTSTCRPASATTRPPRTARSAPTSSTCCRTSSKATSIDSSLGSVPFPPPVGPTTVLLPGQQRRLQPAGGSLPVPFGPERRSGRRRDDRRGYVRRVLLRAERPGVGGTTSPDPPTVTRRARPASPPSRTALRTPSSTPRSTPAAPTRPCRRRSGTAARRGRTARPRVFPWQPPPMTPAGQGVPAGVRDRRPGDPRRPRRHRPRVEVPGPAHAVSGQLRPDPGRDGSPRRHRSAWPTAASARCPRA